MTAEQLIEELRKMPKDAKVLHLWDGAPRTEIQIVYLSREGDVVTSDYGQECYHEECRPVGSPTEAEDKYWRTAENPEEEDE